MAEPLYDDGIYSVTPAIVSTPRRFYPLAYTTASIRRDPLWAGMAAAILGIGALFTYGDLLFLHEQTAIAGIALLSVTAGASFSILRIDAPGHRGAMLIGRSRRIRALFLAIRKARSVDHAPVFESGEVPPE